MLQTAFGSPAVAVVLMAFRGLVGMVGLKLVSMTMPAADTYLGMMVMMGNNIMGQQNNIGHCQ